MQNKIERIEKSASDDSDPSFGPGGGGSGSFGPGGGPGDGPRSFGPGDGGPGSYGPGGGGPGDGAGGSADPDKLRRHSLTGHISEFLRHFEGVGVPVVPHSDDDAVRGPIVGQSKRGHKGSTSSLPTALKSIDCRNSKINSKKNKKTSNFQDLF